MKQLKPGDRVRVYGHEAGFFTIGTVTKLYGVDDQWVSIDISEFKNISAHRKQCRLLTKKPKRAAREFWVNRTEFSGTSGLVAYDSEDRSDECANALRVECIHVREVLPKSNKPRVGKWVTREMLAKAWDECPRVEVARPVSFKDLCERLGLV